MARRQRAPVVGVVVALALATSCGSDSDTVCVSNDVGEVCADNADGQIAFTGNGLDPTSDVTIENSQVGPILYDVDVDGELGSDGSGVMSFIADTEFTFTVYAVDADGQPLVGDIVIRS
jgi:hypothetical protein